MNSVLTNRPLSTITDLAAPPVNQILNEYQLDTCDGIPSASALNALAANRGEQWQGQQFIAQGELTASTLYYEEIIAEQGIVPTREDNWHDLFNALIWLDFPVTKQYLNQLHMADIRQFGLHPRTPRRNRITHFDECGVVLAVPEDKLVLGNEILSLLANHQWTKGFVEHRTDWGRTIFPHMFGHANLEMMLNPFEGLTGKWLAVKVPEGYEILGVNERKQVLDQCLLERIQALGDFDTAKLLKPLPLLGVPGWHVEQTAALYNNTDYFRPLRHPQQPNVQLPLA